jgi:hypothetical protein
MRLFAALLLLAGCGSKSEQRESGGSDPAGLETLVQGPAELSPQQLQARAASAVGTIAEDPRFAEIRAGVSNSVCGQVDAKLPNGKYAGLRPFLVTPEGVAVISAGPRIMFDDPADPFPDLYIRWCATPQEMQTIGPMVAQTAEVSPPEDLPAETIDPVPDGNWGVVPDAMPPPASVKTPPAAPPVAAIKAPAAAAPIRQPGDEDSFFKSVIRAPEEPKATK